MEVLERLFFVDVVIYLVCFLLPPLICLFVGPYSTYRVAKSMVESEDERPIDPHIYNYLIALGLEPLGTLWVHDWIRWTGYGGTRYFRVFGAGESKWYVTIWLDSAREAARVAIITRFRNGAIVITNNVGSHSVRRENQYFQEILTQDIGLLVATHERAVEEFIFNGSETDRHDDIVGLVEVHQRCARPPLRFRLQQCFVSLLVQLWPALLATGLVLVILLAWNRPFASTFGFLALPMSGCLPYIVYFRLAQWLERRRLRNRALE